jgi:hypothetical protein
MAERAQVDGSHEGVHHYIVVFRPEDKDIAMQWDFADSAQAHACFSRAEEQYRDQDELQVVMFSASSFDNVRRTHPHYFKAQDDRSEGGGTAEFLVPA